MWLVFARAPLPDAPYWPGRRLLALVDAIAWPMAWIVLALHLPQPTGIAAPALVLLAALSAVGRAHRAAWQNHRYYFTTWRWGAIAAGLLLIGLAVDVGLRV